MNIEHLLPLQFLPGINMLPVEPRGYVSQKIPIQQITTPKVFNQTNPCTCGRLSRVPQFSPRGLGWLAICQNCNVLAMYLHGKIVSRFVPLLACYKPGDKYLQSNNPAPNPRNALQCSAMLCNALQCDAI